jgi:hypothetical protein
MGLVVTLPRSGGDSNSALGDIWAARPNIRAEDERAERRAAAMAEERQQQRVQQVARIRADAWCPEDSCSKSISGQGCSYLYSLGTQLDSHGSKFNVQDDRYLCLIEDRYRAQPGKGSGTSQAAKYHADTHVEKNAASFLARIQSVDVRNPERGSEPQIIWNAIWSHTREAWPDRSPFASIPAPSASTLVGRSRASICSLSSTRDNTWGKSSRVVGVD